MLGNSIVIILKLNHENTLAGTTGMMFTGQQSSPANSRVIIISHDVLKTFLS
jgi:hypothetical protein